jgi:hypothetical protein
MPFSANSPHDGPPPSRWHVTSPANLPKERGGMAKFGKILTLAAIPSEEQTLNTVKLVTKNDHRL